MLKEERRNQILRAAKKVFALKGYHSTGVADIIQECKVARGTFYLYFKSKRALFETLLDDFLKELERRVLRIDETVGLAGIYRQLRDNVTRVLDAFAENPDMVRIILNEAVGVDKGFDKKLDDFYAGLLEMIEQSLILGIQMGIVRPLDTKVISASVLGSVKEVIHRVLQGRLASGEELSHIVDELLSYNLRALLVPELAQQL